MWIIGYCAILTFFLPEKESNKEKQALRQIAPRV